MVRYGRTFFFFFWFLVLKFDWVFEKDFVELSCVSKKKKVVHEEEESLKEIWLSGWSH